MCVCINTCACVYICAYILYISVCSHWALNCDADFNVSSDELGSVDRRCGPRTVHESMDATTMKAENYSDQCDQLI